MTMRAADTRRHTTTAAPPRAATSTGTTKRRKGIGENFLPIPSRYRAEAMRGHWTKQHPAPESAGWLVAWEAVRLDGALIVADGDKDLRVDRNLGERLGWGRARAARLLAEVRRALDLWLHGEEVDGEEVDGEENHQPAASQTPATHQPSTGHAPANPTQEDGEVSDSDNPRTSQAPATHQPAASQAPATADPISHARENKNKNTSKSNNHNPGVGEEREESAERRALSLPQPPMDGSGSQPAAGRPQQAPRGEHPYDPEALLGALGTAAATITGRVWTPSGDDPEGLAVTPATLRHSGEGRPLYELLRARGWPDLGAWLVQVEEVAEAARACPMPIFANDIRGEGWASKANTSRSIKTLANPERWIERLEAARAWKAQQQAASAPEAAPESDTPAPTLDDCRAALRLVYGPEAAPAPAGGELVSLQAAAAARKRTAADIERMGLHRDVFGMITGEGVQMCIDPENLDRRLLSADGLHAIKSSQRNGAENQNNTKGAGHV